MKIEARLQRETNGILREFLSKASRIRFKTGFAKQIKSPIQKMESQEQSFHSAKLKSQCHLGPGLTGTTTTNNLDTRKEGISLLDGKKWRQLETIPRGLWDTVKHSRWAHGCRSYITGRETWRHTGGEKVQLEWKKAEAETGTAILSALTSSGSCTEEMGEASFHLGGEVCWPTVPRNKWLKCSYLGLGDLV